jgi:hypothetical protein
MSAASTTAGVYTLHPRGRWYRTTVFLRMLWAATFIFCLNVVTPLGSPLWLLIGAACLGIAAASRLARSQLNWRGALLILTAVWLMNWGSFELASRLIRDSLPHSFSLDGLQLQVNAALLALSFTAIVTWVFWRLRAAITLEAIVLASLAIIIFAGHRDFHFDRPKIINTLAWQLRVDHLTMLLTVGSGLLLASISCIFLASLADRPRIDSRPIGRSSNGVNWILGVCLSCVLGSILYGVQYALYQHFNSAMLARVSNGVGMNSEAGVSPLSFESALGSTNQPAALVRLEGDYASNPFTPMMYLRESSLSTFNGHEMVFAGRAYDTDLPGINPQESFTGKEDAELVERTPLVQSIYLLADHQNAFGVDYPLSIVQLKNPKPNRFKNTYRVYSSAPGFSLTDLNDLDVGDPRWTEEVRQHYLTPHSDRRYSDLAIKVTENARTPIEKMFAITNFLSRTAIYTLTPNHDVKREEDQVAPFLFGDHRGYCVHFAHAIVYMARALGIPSRIGTGYLTDLSQSKDGHILLLMSDRHAWAEVYVAQHGWIPFDVQPDQVESHADNKVDPKLLEDLMGMLDPGEEILPPDIAKDEAGMTEEPQDWIPKQSVVVSVMGIFVALIILCKVFLVFGWRAFSSPRRRLRWAYLSAASAFDDVGIGRHFGETRSDFAARVPNQALVPLTELLLKATYSPLARNGSLPEFSATDVTVAISKANTVIKGMPWWKRLIGALNPSSVFKLLRGGKW